MKGIIAGEIDKTEKIWEEMYPPIENTTRNKTHSGFDRAAFSGFTHTEDRFVYDIYIYAYVFYYVTKATLPKPLCVLFCVVSSACICERIFSALGVRALKIRS